MILEKFDAAPRWIVITPCPDIEYWLEAIKVGAAASGLKIVIDGFDVPMMDTTDRPDIIIADEVTRAVASGAEDIVALVPTPYSLPDDLEPGKDDHSTSGISASRILAQVSSLDARHRVIGSDQLLSEGAPLELFPDFVISIPKTPPKPAHSPENSVSQALRALYTGGRAAEHVSLVLPPDLFSYDASSLIEGRLGEFDLTGRPKFLVSGPYLWMPAGTWTARIRFSVDEEASRRRFRLDWGGTADWTEQHFTPDHAGLYEMELTHSFPHAEACEVRFLITEGCFSGRADFYGVTISQALPA